MSREERFELIREIEKARDSRVISYVCGDRHPIGSRISQDAVRPLYEHLRASRAAGVKNIDLLLYSIGGLIDVPWRIVSKIRESCERFTVLIPYKAHSAATMIALGADKIIMGANGELGPIDPITQRVAPGEAGRGVIREEIPVEDVLSYITFLRDRVGLSAQGPLANSLDNLTKNVPPHQVGGIYRAHMHIRLVARKMLILRKPPLEKKRVKAIVDALVEKMYFHGHGIGRTEAKDLGVQVEIPPDDVEENMWRLFCLYEDIVGLTRAFDPETAIPEGETEYNEPNWTVATIESEHKTHVFRGELRLRRVYQMPPQLNIAFNLNFGLPPTLDPHQVQPVLQQIAQQLDSQVRDAVTRQLRQLVPVRLEAKLVGCSWQELTN